MFVLALIATAGLLAGIVFAAVPAAKAAPKGTLEGTITSAGVGVADQRVIVHRYNPRKDGWEDAAVAWTQEDGTFRVRVDAGDYRVSFGRVALGYPRVYVPAARSVWQADDVTIVSGETTTIAGEVTRQRGITGTVRGTTERNSYGIGVTAEDTATGRQYRTRTTRISGSAINYGLWNVPAGTYRVSFDRVSGYSTHAAQWYDGVAEGAGPEGADVVAVADGDPATDVDADLAQGGVVTARMKDSDGDDAWDDCRVEAFSADARLIARTGNSDSYWWDPVSGSSFEQMRVTGLASGKYSLRFTDCYYFHEDLYYDGTDQLTTEPSTATFDAQQGATVDLGALRYPDRSEVGSGLSVTGTVALPAGDPTYVDRWVRLVGVDGTGYRYSTQIDEETGAYAFGDVRPGTYRVAFARASGQALSAAQFYNGKAEHLGVDSADLIDVSDESVTGVDATLVEGGHFTGRVLDVSGNPLPGCRVVAFTDYGGLVGRSTSTGADGTFDLTGLTTGSYKVLVSGGEYYDEAQDRFIYNCYDGLRFLDEAGDLAEDGAVAETQSITIGGSASLGDLTYVERPQASVSGTVAITGVDLNNRNQYRKVKDGDREVRLHALDGTVVQTTRFSRGGGFWFDEVPPGDYRVSYARSAQSSKRLAARFYPGVLETEGTGDVITLADGDEVTLDPVTLDEGAVLRGRVSLDGAAADGCLVTAYLRDGSVLPRSGTSSASGNYLIRGLAPGTYSVKASRCEGDVQYLQDVSGEMARTEAATDLVTVSTAQETRQDLLLVPGAAIKVNVDIPDGVDTEGNVAVVDTVTGRVAGTRTFHTDRPVTFRGLAAGSYRIEFNRISGHATAFRAGYHYNLPDTARADVTPIVVGADETFDAGTQSILLGGRLIGSVVDAHGAALADCDVRSFDDDAELAARRAATDGGGAFTVRGLTPTGYLLQVSCDGETRFYDGDDTLTEDESAATKVTVTAGQVDLGRLWFADSSPEPEPEPVIVSSAKPAIAGTAKVGVELSASTGSWKVGDAEATGLEFHYVWKAGEAAVGADSPKFTPAASEVGKAITVTVTASKAGHAPGTATSEATLPVAPAGTDPEPEPEPDPVIVSSAKPAIAGTAKVGVELSASTGSWKVGDAEASGLTFTYAWKAGATAVGSNSPKFTPAPSEVGKAITVTVTASKAGHTSGTATSEATLPVAPAGTDPEPEPEPDPVIVSSAKPAIAGTAKVGVELSASTGSWTVSGSAATGLTFAYQWKSGGVNVGTNASTYTPVAGDVGKAITVTVTASKAGHTSGTATSEATGQVAAADVTPDPNPNPNPNPQPSQACVAAQGAVTSAAGVLDQSNNQLAKAKKKLKKLKKAKAAKPKVKKAKAKVKKAKQAVGTATGSVATANGQVAASC